MTDQGRVLHSEEKDRKRSRLRRRAKSSDEVGGLESGKEGLRMRRTAVADPILASDPKPR